MHFDKQLHKNQSTKNPPQYYNYSSKNAMSSFKQAKCCNICSLENFKKFELYITFSSASTSLPACLPTGTDLEPVSLHI